MRRKILLVVLLVFTLGTMNTLFAEEFTLGLVQSKVKKGMSQGEVAQVIGSPNMASKDRDGHETWIYDKVSSETKTEGKMKEKSSGFAVGGLGFLGSLMGIAGGIGSKKGQQEEKTNVKTTKKTLTVVIKFDKNSMVQEINYHMSKF